MDIKNTNNTSDEVADIIDKIPNRTAIALTAFVVLLVFTLFAFSYLVKYPDVVSGEFSLNSSANPIKLTSSQSGNLVLRQYKSKGYVRSGTLIAYVKSSANVNDIQAVDSLLKAVNINVAKGFKRNFFPNEVNLGELNERYFNFLRFYNNLIDLASINVYLQQEDILKKQAESQRSSIHSTERDISLAKKSYELVISSYQRDSVLFHRKVLSLSDFELTRMQMLSAQRNYDALLEKIQLGQYQLEDISSRLKQLSIQRSDAKLDVDIKARSAYFELIEGIKQWQLRYAFIAPTDGILQFNGFWATGDYVTPGQEIFSVIPVEKNLYGQLNLPETGAGKVKIGQKVNIKLNDFPYNEYGSLRGHVKDISMTANQKRMSNDKMENLYLVTISLDSGLITNYGTKLSFRFGAKGIADIVTNDRRLYSRIFDKLVYQAHRQ